MGGGSTRLDHPPVPQFRTTPDKLSSPSSSSPPNLKSSLSTENNSMRLTPPNSNIFCSSCHSQLCRELKPVDGKEAKTANSRLCDHVFEAVPSQREVEEAISALLNFIQAVSSSRTGQQISSSYDSRIFLSEGYRRLHDAIQLLQIDPSIKRLVVSLSSDKAIWDAVMSNVRHQKLLEIPDSVERKRPQISEENEFGIYMLSWILEIIQGKIWELIESFQSLMNDLFHNHRVENATVHPTVMHEQLRLSLLLCIMILLIVIMARSEMS